MKYQDSHLSDQTLLLDLEGELSTRDAKQVLGHITACWKCRARRQELEKAITDFVRVYRQELDRTLPPVDGPRALLKAQLAQLSSSQPKGRPNAFRLLGKSTWAAVMCGFLAFGLVLSRPMIDRLNRRSIPAVVVFVPDSRLTPGATVLASRRAVCSQVSANNKSVPAAMQRQVFEE